MPFYADLDADAGLVLTTSMVPSIVVMNTVVPWDRAVARLLYRGASAVSRSHDGRHRGGDAAGQVAGIPLRSCDPDCCDVD